MGSSSAAPVTIPGPTFARTRTTFAHHEADWRLCGFEECLSTVRLRLRRLSLGFMKGFGNAKNTPALVQKRGLRLEYRTHRLWLRAIFSAPKGVDKQIGRARGPVLPSPDPISSGALASRCSPRRLETLESDRDPTDVREHVGRQIGADGRVDTGEDGIADLSKTPLDDTDDFFMGAYGGK